MTDVILPEGWPRPHGYANGVSADGRVIAVAGQIGWDAVRERIVAPDFVAQVDQALANVVTILRAAGAAPEHVVRLTWFVTSREAYLGARRELTATWRRHFGAHYPAMSVIFVAGLLDPAALVEIEATAVVPRPM